MSDLDAIGFDIDQRLGRLDIRLTQGGEPTLVPFRPEGAEWATEALGPEKLLYARRLAARLLDSLFPGAVVLRSSGKLYPGEPLPRWSLSLFRRRIGSALWNRPERLLLEGPSDPSPAPDHPRRLLEDLSRRLGLENSVQPVYEDLVDWLWRHHPDRAGLIRPAVSRSEGGRVVTPELVCDGLTGWETVCRPSGWVLPLERSEDRWVTETWQIPGESEITLIPGDSSVGLRLPLGRLKEDALRCAVTAECKEGELMIFLPPLPDFESFVQLIAALESVLESGAFPPVVFEGYPPPRDPSLESISMSSDPGVLEVNLPPAADFQQLAEWIRTLYRDAEAIGLCGRKFQFNGRMVGSGGGAHVLLGGPSIEDNPFLRAPHLLPGWLRFLNHHPSLSYLFSGNFIGPSCQAPRPDESAQGMLEELEIAAEAMASQSPDADPELVDRLFRNLLMDWNGNTHRAEVCLDKFYNAAAPNGKMGVIEFRAVEMPPDSESFLAINLLFRAVSLVLMEHPFREPLRHWGDRLHDRFLLPSLLKQDLEKVLQWLRQSGVAFPVEFFEPFLEFRLPLLYRAELNGGIFEIRQALEPWPAIGSDGGGTSRKVDSSADRVELSVTGETAKSWRLLVNHRSVPLQELSATRRLAGVRFKAFENDFGLHPHLKPQVPLRIEILDGSLNSVIHAVEYSTWRFDGGGYEGLPENESKAKERIRQRTRVLESAIGRPVRDRLDPPEASTSWTMDLRRFAEPSRQ